MISVFLYPYFHKKSLYRLFDTGFFITLYKDYMCIDLFSVASNAASLNDSVNVGCA